MKITKILTTSIMAIILLIPVFVWAQGMHPEGGQDYQRYDNRRSPYRHGGGYSAGGWSCPWCGRGQYGPGMMSRGMGASPQSGYGMGYGMGPGMMHGRRGRGYHDGWDERQPQRPYGSAENYRQREPLNKDEARSILKNTPIIRNNPNLKVGEITEHENYFEGEILTKDDSLADKIQVNKQTGWIRSAYD